MNVEELKKYLESIPNDAKVQIGVGRGYTEELETEDINYCEVDNKIYLERLEGH